MTLLIYRPQPSKGAVALAASLRAAGIDAKKVSRLPRRHLDRHKVVNWGATNETGLNASPPRGKLGEINALTNAGVPTVTASMADHSDDAAWVFRNHSHCGGNDLLNPEAARRRGGFWVKKEEIAREYRVHVWGGQSIRAGRKDKVDLIDPNCPEHGRQGGVL